MMSVVSASILTVFLGIAIATQALAFGTGFIENRGQVDDQVLYYAAGSRVGVYFTAEALVIDLKEHPQRKGGDPLAATEAGDPWNDERGSDGPPRKGCAVWIYFDGANPPPRVEARDELRCRYNYFLGNDPRDWRTDVPAYAEVIYRGVWPGIDLIFFEEGDVLALRAVSDPGARLSQIRFSYRGATEVSGLADGSRVIRTPVGLVREIPPSSEDGAGLFRWVDMGAGSGDGGFTRCPAAGRDSSHLHWGTFLGDSDDEQSEAVAIDPFGHVVVTGSTGSNGFPVTPGVYDESFGGINDLFVSKFDPSDGSLLWSTYLGGDNDEGALGVVLDLSGNPVVTGYTGSTDFPATSGAYDESHNGDYDVVVSKLSSSGASLLWSTYLGASNEEKGYALALDPSGNPVVGGVTESSGFPTTPGAYQTSFGGGEDDGFVFKLDSSGTALLWSTFLGGDLYDSIRALALDPSGNPVVTGDTKSPGFPTTPGAYDVSIDGYADAFVSKLGSSGDALLWSTFLGGWYYDAGSGIAIDPSGRPVVAGRVLSNDFPTTPGAYDESHNGESDCFLSMLDALGENLLWSTFFGGSGSESYVALAIDASGNCVIAGETTSPDLPTTPGAFDDRLDGDKDGFVSSLDSSGGTLGWSSYLGGSNGDGANSLALDPTGNPILTGYTASSDFPSTPGAYDESFNGFYDGFVAKIALSTGTEVPSPKARSMADLLGRNTPNPFNLHTIIEFRIAAPAAVALSVYDVHGRCLRSLVQNDCSPGVYTAAWDGTDSAGRPVASGVYFYRLESNGESETRRMILLR